MSYHHPIVPEPQIRTPHCFQHISFTDLHMQRTQMLMKSCRITVLLKPGSESACDSFFYTGVLSENRLEHRSRRFSYVVWVDISAISDSAASSLWSPANSWQHSCSFLCDRMMMRTVWRAAGWSPRWCPSQTLCTAAPEPSASRLGWVNQSEPEHLHQPESLCRSLFLKPVKIQSKQTFRPKTAPCYT